MIFIAFIGGMLTLLNPCILPILPLVVASIKRPFYRHGLPFFIGLAFMFTLVATVAVSSSHWLIQASQIGRWLALGIFTIFALSLCSQTFSQWVMSPFVRMGNGLNNVAQKRTGVFASFLLGSATGLLWLPCAGPILGLIMSGAMLQGANIHTSLLLLAYVSGVVTVLAVFALLSNRVLSVINRGMGMAEGMRRALGGLILGVLLLIVTGGDQKIMSMWTSEPVVRLETLLLNTLTNTEEISFGAQAQTLNQPEIKIPTLTLKDYGKMPALEGGTQWIGSEPLQQDQLLGKVVLVDFWTFDCINCIRSHPHVDAWEKKYRDQGLVVVGVHTPEYTHEKSVDNVKKAVNNWGITYPVVMDNDYMIWRAFKNRYWPAHYFVDVKGKIRYFHFGEGSYKKQEQVIQQLLTEVEVL